MEKVTEPEIDYFLRYVVDVPADEINSHQIFSRDCPCKPDVEFDDMNGWHSLEHKKFLVEQGG